MVTGIQNPASITVAIATYNRRDMLERAVRSVLDECRVPIILHVQDNASTDGTEAFMRSLADQDGRVRYVRNDSNLGCYANITATLNAVQSKYFVPLADDDFLLPDFLFDAYAIMEKDDTLGATAFYAEARTDSGQLICTWPNDISAMSEGRVDPAEHLRNWMVTSHYSWQAVLWNAKVLEFLGAPYLHTGLPSDVDFQAQIFVKFPVFVVKRPGAIFSVHAGQASHGLNVGDVHSWAKLFSRLDEAVEAANLLPQDEYRARRAILWRRMRPSWLRQTRSPASMSALARYAVTAGFLLGDWEAAFHLAAEVRRQQARLAESSLDSGPQSSSGQTGVAGQGLRRRLNRGLEILEAMNEREQREKTLVAQVDALVAGSRTLQEAALAVTAERNRLALELATLRGQPRSAERPVGDEQTELFPRRRPA